MLRALSKFIFLSCLFVSFVTTHAWGYNREGCSCSGTTCSFGSSYNNGYDIRGNCQECPDRSDWATQHIASCGGNGNDHFMTCVPGYTLQEVWRNNEWRYECRCADNEFEYHTDGNAIAAGNWNFVCGTCSNNSMTLSCGWDGSQYIGTISCGTGSSVASFGCNNCSESQYLYTATNGTKTCNTCPTGEMAWGVSSCGNGNFECDLSHIRSRYNDDTYRCALCWVQSNSDVPGLYDHNTGDFSYRAYISGYYVGDYFSEYQDFSAIGITLGANCTATRIQDNYAGASGQSCTSTQYYKTIGAVKDADYDANRNAARSGYALESVTFTEVAADSYINTSGTYGVCKKCPSGTKSFGGSYVDKCFSESSNLISDSLCINGYYNAGTGDTLVCAQCDTYDDGMGNSAQSVSSHGGSMNTPGPADVCYVPQNRTITDDSGTYIVDGERGCDYEAATASGAQFCVSSQKCATVLGLSNGQYSICDSTTLSGVSVMKNPSDNTSWHMMSNTNIPSTWQDVGCALFKYVY